MDEAELRDKATAELNRVAKWRTVLTGQVAGTRQRGDPVGEGYRDLFEKLILLRVEVTAITRLMLEKGLVSQAEVMQAVLEEAEALDKAYEARYPGMQATNDGITMDVEVATKTTEGWPP